METLTHADISTALRRHVAGDWGEVFCPEDAAENELSLTQGFRLLSVYRGANGTRFYIITEADRSVTTDGKILIWPKNSCQMAALSHLMDTMPALVIKSFPEALHAKLRQIAAAHRRSVTQETIHLIETAIAAEDKIPPDTNATNVSYWANRKLLPEYEAALKAGAFSGGTDSTQIISEERDAR